MFKSPDELKNCVLDISSLLREEGLVEQSELLEDKANLACTTGWEWLGELGAGVETVLNSGSLSPNTEASLRKVLEATKSTKPYGD